MFAQLIRKKAKRYPIGILRRLANWWLPFRGAGIKVLSVSPDYHRVEVEMRLRWFNKNYVGTHFGGSLYAMADPFLMMMLMNNLGQNYIVWDKAAKIDFRKPGRGTVHVCFQIDEDEIQKIKSMADAQGKYVFDKVVNIVDESGDVVAEVIKTLYVRRR